MTGQSRTAGVSPWVAVDSAFGRLVEGLTTRLQP
jgi:hypothetical protein